MIFGWAAFLILLDLHKQSPIRPRVVPVKNALHAEGVRAGGTGTGSPQAPLLVDPAGPGGSRSIKLAHVSIFIKQLGCQSGADHKWDGSLIPSIISVEAQATIPLSKIQTLVAQVPSPRSQDDETLITSCRLLRNGIHPVYPSAVTRPSHP